MHYSFSRQPYIKKKACLFSVSYTATVEIARNQHHINILIYNMTAEKARELEPEETSVALQRLSEHVSLASYRLATIEEILEGVFSVRSMPRLYNEDTGCV
jgi:hypothetical protein